MVKNGGEIGHKIDFSQFFCLVKNLVVLCDREGGWGTKIEKKITKIFACKEQ